MLPNQEIRFHKNNRNRLCCKNLFRKTWTKKEKQSRGSKTKSSSLNVHEADRNDSDELELLPSPFAYCPVICECQGKKTHTKEYIFSAFSKLPPP